MSISELPVISGRRAVRVFEHFGWQYRGKSKGHFVLTKHGVKYGDIYVHLSIPDHREVDRRLLHKLVKMAGLTDKQFRQAHDEL